jgi:cystathionine beta-lyase
MGFSWGGFESLIIPANVARAKRTLAWSVPGPYLRLHVGLEDVEDLIADLADGLGRLRG